MTKQQVFPTHVGVNRKRCALFCVAICIPHARGGEPQPKDQFRNRHKRIPHARGGEPDVTVATKGGNGRIPHARGGEPTTPSAVSTSYRVFPTHVGVNRI